MVGLLLALIVTVFVRAWPSFAHNGLAWFGPGGNVDDQLNQIYLSGLGGAHYVYTFHAWQLIWSTILIVGGAIVIALFTALFVSVFIVEFAPEWMRNILQPVVRFLASVPSVIYGLLGVLVLVPFIGNHLVTEPQKASVAGVISLTGYSLLAAILILTVMIAPLMVSIFTDGLRSVRPGWLEGSLALGVNRWRTTWKIAVRTARPAIVAGTVLAMARAIGEAVMLAMVSGSVAFAPEPGRRPRSSSTSPRGRWRRRSSRTSTRSARSRPTRPSSRSPRSCSSRRRSSPSPAGSPAARCANTGPRPDGVIDRHRRRRRSEPPADTPAAPPRAPVEGSATWHLSDRIGLAICWALGLLFCAIAVAIVVYLFIQGIKFLKPSMLVTPASAGFTEAQTGGFSDAFIGTLIVAVMGISLALPAGVGIAVWLVEYGRPAALARITESTIEAIAGIPSIVLALFGTVIFSSTALGFLSRTSEGVVFGRSFFAAAAMLSLVALPLIVASTREGLNSIPQHVREASYAVGKTKARDDAADPAPHRPPPGRDRGDARPRPDHRRHRDHRRPARRHPELRPGRQSPSRSTTCAEPAPP